MCHQVSPPASTAMPACSSAATDANGLRQSIGQGLHTSRCTLPGASHCLAQQRGRQRSGAVNTAHCQDTRCPANHHPPSTTPPKPTSQQPQSRGKAAATPPNRHACVGRCTTSAARHTGRQLRHSAHSHPEDPLPSPAAPHSAANKTQATQPATEKSRTTCRR